MIRFSRSQKRLKKHKVPNSFEFLGLEPHFQSTQATGHTWTKTRAESWFASHTGLNALRTTATDHASNSRHCTLLPL